jgi:hypothetical protein
MRWRALVSIACLFVCVLVADQAVAQTAGTQPVGKPVELLQFMHSDSAAAKPHENSVAKNRSKSHFAAKEPATTKRASRESRANEASRATAMGVSNAAAREPSAPTSETIRPPVMQAIAVPTLRPGLTTSSKIAIDHQNVPVVSPDDANEIDLATSEQSAPASDALLGAATAVKETNTETAAPADKPDSGAAIVSQTPSINVGGASWLLQVMAALGIAVVTGVVAWFLVGSAPLQVSGRLNARRYRGAANSRTAMLAFHTGLKPFNNLAAHVNDAINYVFRLYRRISCQT